MSDGGPAFPRPVSMSTYWDHPREIPEQEGMTLRDYFAAAALTGWLSDGHVNTPSVDAARAYEYADAMLKAREATNDHK